MDKINCQQPTYAEMDEYAAQTSKKIKESGFYPDIIIGLSRGGLVPARMFCDYLHIKKAYTIKVDHWGLTATRDGKAKLSQALDMDISGLNVLVVDDITDTGESMKLAIEYIKSKDPANVKTATLIHLDNSAYTPDFYGHEQPWAWIIFPWNKHEDYVNLILKTGKSDIEDIKASLKENCNVELASDAIEDMLKHIAFLKTKGIIQAQE